MTTSPIMFIGVDAGVVGGIATLCGGAAYAVTMPQGEAAIWKYIQRAIPSPGNSVGALEQVGGYISKDSGPACPICKRKRNDQPASSAFEFGDAYGTVKMGLIGVGLGKTKADPKIGTFYLCPPQEWQRGLGIDPRRKEKDESKEEYKRRLKWNAEQLFPKKHYPTLKITLGTCDALLIAYYIRQKYTTGA